MPESANTTPQPKKVYFGVRQTKTFYFPGDKDQYIEHKKLNEGERQRYEDQTGRQLSLDQKTSEVRMALSSGHDRSVLFKLVLVKYHVYLNEGGPEPVLKEGSDAQTWEQLIKDMDGELAQLFFDEVRELNPWLKASEADVKARLEKKEN